MASGRSLRGYSAEHTAAGRGARRPRTILGLTAVAVLAVLGVGARASALTITGGPVYTLPGGGRCSLSGSATCASTGGGVTGTVVATGGTPAGNSNGVIGDLFSLPTGLSSASFTVTGKINASAPTFALQAALTAYDNTHTPASGASDFSKVDLAFYFSDCGDGVVDSPEQCDTGSANGTTAPCCTSTCTFKTNGTAGTDDATVL